MIHCYFYHKIAFTVFQVACNVIPLKPFIVVCRVLIHKIKLVEELRVSLALLKYLIKG